MVVIWSVITDQFFRSVIWSVIWLFLVVRAERVRHQIQAKNSNKRADLAGFVMEFSSAELAEATQTTPDLPIWRLSIDGAADAQGSGANMR